MSGKNYAALALRGLGESQKNNEGGGMGHITPSAIDNPDPTDGCPDCEGEGVPLPVDADLERYSKCGNCKGWLPLEEEA